MNPGPLPPSVVLNIRHDYAQGMTALALSSKYAVARGAIYKITSGETYRNVGGPLRAKRPRLAPDMTPDEVRAEGRARLIARVDLSLDGCWLWNRATDAKGYATMHLQGKDHRAHRLAYELFVGPIPSGLEIEHACHGRDVSCFAGSDCQHRRCCRPDHLVPVDHATNIRSGRSWSIHGLKTHCPQGHPYDGTNTRFMPQPNGGMSRACRTCAREKRRVQRARQRQARHTPQQPAPEAAPTRVITVDSDDVTPSQGVADDQMMPQSKMPDRASTHPTVSSSVTSVPVRLDAASTTVQAASATLESAVDPAQPRMPLT